MRIRLVLAMVVLFMWNTPNIYAGEEKKSDEYEIEDITVQATGTVPNKDAISKETLESGRFTNVGEVLTETPGVSAVRRGASATEPVIRGLGWERVTTQVDGLPLYGACPARMDPPMTYVRSYTPEEIRIVNGLA